MTRTRTRPVRRLASLACVACAAGLAAAATPALASDAGSFGSAVGEAVGRAGPGTPQAPARPLAVAAVASEESGLDAITGGPVLYDAVDDGYPAPDIEAVVPFTLSDDGTFNVGIVLNTNALIEGDSVVSFVNTDGNAGTGEPAFEGADVAVADHRPLRAGRGGDRGVGRRLLPGGLLPLADLLRLGRHRRGVVDRRRRAGHRARYQDGHRRRLDVRRRRRPVLDFAPEPGSPPLAFTTPAATPPPVPATTTPRAPSPATPTATASPAGGPGATPVSVRSFAVTATPSGVRLRLGWVRGEGRVRWSRRALDPYRRPPRPPDHPRRRSGRRADGPAHSAAARLLARPARRRAPHPRRRRPDGRRAPERSGDEAPRPRARCRRRARPLRGGHRGGRRRPPGSSGSSGPATPTGSRRSSARPASPRRGWRASVRLR